MRDEYRRKSEKVGDCARADATADYLRGLRAGISGEMRNSVSHAELIGLQDGYRERSDRFGDLAVHAFVLGLRHDADATTRGHYWRRHAWIADERDRFWQYAGGGNY